MRALAVAIIIAIPAGICAGQQATLVHGCEGLDGVRVSVGAERPETLLTNAWAAEYVTEGVAGVRISSRSPEDTEGNTYVAVDLDIEPTDFTERGLAVDAATSLPETSRAFYVRGFDDRGSIVMSWSNWEGLLTTQMQTFTLYPGFRSGEMKWEPGRIEAADRSAVVRLRFYTGTSEKGADFSLYLDNIRAVEPGPLLHSCDSTAGVSLFWGGELPETRLEVSRDEALVTEGEACVHARTVSPGEAEGTTYLAVTVDVPPHDFGEGLALLVDAASSTPEHSAAFYVRGYDTEGRCAMSWSDWSSPLTARMQTFWLTPAESGALAWEPQGLDEGGDLSRIVRLRLFVGTRDTAAPIDLYFDNIRLEPTE